MRSFDVIPGITLSEVGAAIFERLCELYPEGRDRSRQLFKVRLGSDDPRMRQIIETLDAAGFTRWVSTGSKYEHGKHYQLRHLREYQEVDVRQAELLRVVCAEMIGDDGDQRNAQGAMMIVARDVPAKPASKIYLSAMGATVVPNAVRAKLEESGLRDLVFRETIARHVVDRDDQYFEDRLWESPEKSWWELRSDVTLPPLSPSMIFMDGYGKVLPPRDPQATLFKDSADFQDAEFHYLRSELNQLPPFDLAAPRERTLKDVLIASIRLYTFCKQHGIDCDWKPVRIDEP